DLLGINVQAPYLGWPNFSKLISEQFGTYVEIASPRAFKRIGLRYINAIQFPTQEIEITRYFRYYPYLPEDIEQKYGPFTMRVMHPSDDERDTLTVNFANVVPSQTL